MSENESSGRSLDLRAPSRAQAETAVRTLIAWLGDDPEREGLRDTPRRVAAALGELFDGYGADRIAPPVPRTVETARNNIVVMRDIAVVSHCEHHMLPVVGRAYIACLPGAWALDTWTVTRLVDRYARRLQTQERLTADILVALEAHLAPRGLAVRLDCQHLCIAMRGIGKSGLSTVTQRFSGAFCDVDLQERVTALLHAQ